MKSDIRYTPETCFDTLPLISDKSGSLSSCGEFYYSVRQEIMRLREEGLTKIYRRFHDFSEQSQDIAQLRTLHVEMDQAVASVYGWNDLDLGHGFHETKQGVRFTISETARREVLDRLLALNHQRYTEEVAAGLHEKSGIRLLVQSEQGRAMPVTQRRN